MKRLCLERAWWFKAAALTFMILMPEAFVRTAMAFGDWPEFRRQIDRNLALATPPEFVLRDGIDKLRRRGVLGARSSFAEMPKRWHTEVRAIEGREQTYLAQSDKRGAVKKIQQSASKAAGSPQVQLRLGDWLLKNGDATGARKAYSAALGSSLDSPIARLKLAGLDASEGNFEQARHGLERVLSAQPNNAAALLTLAAVEESSADHEKAREHYLQLLELQPENVVALNNLAYRLATDKQQLDEALKYAERAKEAAPDNPYVDDTLGWVYYLKGLYDSALPHLERSASELTKQATIHYHLAMTYLRLNSLQQGQEALETALRLDPELPEAAMAQQLLAELKAGSR